MPAPERRQNVLPASSMPVRNSPVLQGEFRISNDPGECLVTVLGSCVATCLWDDEAGVGGMNHFLLAGANEPRDGNLKYGINSMELLINGLLQAGAKRKRLKAKLFGGAKMLNISRQIGQENAEFALWFLGSEGISNVGQCLGGDRGRKVRFSPVNGNAQRMFLGDPMDIDHRNKFSCRSARATAQRNAASTMDVELF